MTAKNKKTDDLKNDLKKQLKESKEQFAECLTQAGEYKSQLDEAKKQIEEMRDQNSKLQTEKEVLQEKPLRLAAELDNYKKRQQKLFTSMTQQFRDELISRYLDVLDNFERALSACPTDAHDDYIEGFRMIGQQMLDFLKQENIVQIDDEGQPFDPNFHEAIHKMPSDEHPANTIINTAQKGYKRGDKLIRPAKVVVSFREEE